MFCWRTTSRSMSPGSKPAGRGGHRYDLTRARVVRGTHAEGVDACAGVTVVQGGKPPTPGVKPAARTIRDACPGLWLNTVVYVRGGFFQDSSPSQRACLGAGICSYTRSQRLTCTGASTLKSTKYPQWGRALVITRRRDSKHIHGSSSRSRRRAAAARPRRSRWRRWRSHACGAVSVRLRLRLSACTAIGICRHLKTGLQCGDSSPMQRADFSFRL